MNFRAIGMLLAVPVIMGLTWFQSWYASSYYFEVEATLVSQETGCYLERNNIQFNVPGSGDVFYFKCSEANIRASANGFTSEEVFPYVNLLYAYKSPHDQSTKTQSYRIFRYDSHTDQLPKTRNVYISHSTPEEFMLGKNFIL